MMDKYYSLSVLVRHEQDGHKSDDVSEAERNSDNNGTNSQQELALLTAQIAPILDRTGRLVTDMAGIMGRPEDGNGVPMMSSPLELAAVNPRAASDLHLHVNAVLEHNDDRDRGACWRQIS